MAFIIGNFVNWMKTWKLPKWCEGLMPVMFIPAAVGLLNAWDVLRPVVVPVVVVTVVTTVLVMGVTGQVTQRVIRWERKRKEGKEK